MWQSTISLRYVSYKNADSNLHERICAMAMLAKNLLWRCAQIVAPRPPINPQRPRKKLGAQVIDMERRLHFKFLTSLLPVRRGWLANHALRIRPSRPGCNRTP